MDGQNAENPFLGKGGPLVLIDRMIGSAYEVVKYVACHMKEILIVADWIKSLQAPIVSLPSTSIINIVNWASTVVFDASLAFLQQITLTGNVDASSIIHTDIGFNVLIIRVIQDNVGGHTFAWPPTITAHGDIDMTPNSISQQMFAKNSDGTWTYVNPMMYPTH